MDISAATRPTQSPDPATPLVPQTRDVIQAVKALNATEMFGDENELTFQIDQQSQRMGDSNRQPEYKEVISQIPPEYVLALHADLKKQQKE